MLKDSEECWVMFHGAEPRFADPRLISFLATNSEMIKLFNQTVKLVSLKTILKTTFHRNITRFIRKRWSVSQTTECADHGLQQEQCATCSSEVKIEKRVWHEVNMTRPRIVSTNSFVVSRKASDKIWILFQTHFNWKLRNSSFLQNGIR